MYAQLSRLRRTSGLRTMFQEQRLSPQDFIFPIFVSEGDREKVPIGSMPGMYRWPVSALSEVIDEVIASGVGTVLLFGIPNSKDPNGTQAYAENGIVQQAVRKIKSIASELVVITDVCLCEYTDNGHCGVFTEGNTTFPDCAETVKLLAATAVSHAAAGADMVAPSSMMDGQVGAIRRALDEAGFGEVPVMGYSAKFCSGFYGPFRDAADSAPAFGNRSAYQHQPSNLRHSMREIQADIDEGADVLMVKPGLPYLDVLALASKQFDLPFAVYQVSGEFAMIKAAAMNNWINEKQVALESLIAFKRAGAQLIITYYAIEASRWLKDN